MSDATRFVITGFMGAGKTTVARALARMLGCDAFDLDRFITEREGRTPQRLIEDEGEAVFRMRETEALRVLLADAGARVIAAGGGTWMIEENRLLLNAHGCFVVWLDAPFDLCWRRIKDDTRIVRPLARDRRKAHELYKTRRSLYALDTLRVEVSEESSAEEIAAQIINSARPSAHVRACERQENQ